MILARKARPRKTAEDYRNLPEGTRAELIDRDLFMRPSPGDSHQRAVANLHLLLGAFVKAHKLGRVYTAPFDVYLPSGDIVEPDLLFISQANLGIVQ